MLDVKKEGALEKLHSAVKKSYERLEKHRKNHYDLVKQYAGPRYVDGSGDEEILLNMQGIALGIYTQALMAKPPQITSRTRNRKYKGAGFKLETLVNEQSEDARILHALQKTVRNSLFSIGLMKVGIRPSGEVAIEGEPVPMTEAYMEPILLEDWVQDMTAGSLCDADFYGHKYRVPVDELRDKTEWNQAVRKKIELEGESKGNDGDRLNELTGGTGDGCLTKYVEVWEIFLRREQKVVTYWTGWLETPLEVKPWKGPPHGFVRSLFYDEVDGNGMPLAPALTWAPLAELINTLTIKLAEQARRQKNIGLAMAGSEDDARSVMSASDGQVVPVSNSMAIQEANFGGIDQQSFGFMLQLKQLYSWAAGNLDTLGGLATASNTATQDAILNRNSSAKIDAMQERVAQFTKQVFTDFAYWMWTDPVLTYEAEIEVPGMGKMPVALTPQERDHEFFEHELDIVPHSMTALTPQQKLGQIRQLMQTVLMPAMPMLQAQGININIAEYLKLEAKYGGVDEVNDLISVDGAALNADTATPNRPAAPPVKVSTENRVSKGAGGMQGDESSMIQRLMAGSKQ